MRLSRFLAAFLLPVSSALAQTTAFLPNYLPADPARYCTRVYSYSLGLGGAIVSDLGGPMQIPYRSGSVSAMWVNGWPQNPGQRLAFANDGKRLIIPAAFEEPGTGAVFLSKDCNASGPPDGRSFDSVVDGALMDQGPGYASIGGKCQQVMGGGKILVEVQNLVVRGARYDNAVIIWMLDTAKSHRTLAFAGKDEEIGLRAPTSARTRGAAITEFIALGNDTGAILGGDIDAGTGQVTMIWELTGATCADGAVPLETGLWTATGPPGWDVPVLAVHPRDPSILLAGSTYGITRSADGGETWHPANTGLRIGNVAAIAFAPSSPDTVYAGVWDRGLFRSTDSGRSWVRVSILRNISSLAVHPTDPNTLYMAGTQPDSYGNAGYGSEGIFVTHDGGSSLTSLGRVASLGPSATSFTAVALLPDDPGVVCAGISSTTAAAVYCKPEKNTQWTKIFEAGAKTEGSVTAIQFDPANSNVAYILCVGLYKTTDRGGAWSRVVNSSEPTGLTEPENGLGGASLLLDSLTGDLYVGARGGVLRSTDGGGTWKAGTYSYELMETEFRSLGLSRGRLFAGVRERGILRSLDNGLTWEVAQAGQYTLESVHANLSGSGDILGGDRFYGFFRSRGGVGVWERLSDLRPGRVLSIVSTPDTPDRLFASTSAHGLLRSDDAGETWTGTGEYVTDFTIDSSNSSRFYGRKWDGIWKSEDAGATWTQVAPAPPPRGASVFAVEPGPSGKLYVGFQLVGGLYVWTPDSGAWKRLAPDNVKLSNVRSIAVEPSPGGTIWLGTGLYVEPGAGYGRPGGLWVSHDGGDAWDEVKLPLTVSALAKILFDPFYPATIYAFGYVMDSNAAALFVSTDGGSTWRAYQEIDMGEIEQLAPDPASPGRIYAAGDRGLKVIQIGAPAIVPK